VSCFHLPSLDKSRGECIHVQIVSRTDIKKRPGIDVLPQDENTHDFFFLIGHCEAPLSGYKYARVAMRTSHC
jgi:hypothetical protein